MTTSRQELMMDFIAHSQSLAFLDFDDKGLVRDMNVYTKELLGEAILGKSFRDVFVDFENRLDLESLYAQTDAPRLLSISTASGMPQSFFFSFYPVEGGGIAIGEQNNTEVEQLRRHLTSVNQELSNQGRELHKANAELRRLNELKNEFLGMAAHDLRTPIGNIYSLSDLLLNDLDDDMSEDHVELMATIKELSEFLLTMLESLLDITAFESGKMRLNLAPGNPGDFIRQAVNLGRLYAHKKDIEILLHMPEALLPEMRLDGIKIRQAVDNLISNAVKFSPRGSQVTVDVVLEPTQVTTSVRDQGCGIRPEDMTKLFKPFSKTAAAATEGEKSTGLGLCIVKRIIEAHAGRIWAQNSPEGGATFVIALPLKNA